MALPTCMRARVHVRVRVYAHGKCARVVRVRVCAHGKSSCVSARRPRGGGVAVCVYVCVFCGMG